MSHFAHGTFDLVIFSYNGIDYVAHVDRLKILAEIRRVLKRGGVFFFSSHNRDYSGLTDVRKPAVALTWHPLKLAYRFAAYGHARWNSRRLARRTIEWDEYAILNDKALNHGLLTYYVSCEKQHEQLVHAGFARIEIFDTKGREIEARGAFRDDFMIHYLAHCV